MTEPVDYSTTLYLPKTDFPMRGGLPQKEPEILARWAAEDIYGQLRKASAGRSKFVLHDGPPYANGHIHIGTALNKTLKDLVVRSQQMLGRDSNYVPGWDCHGLPIEWKVEEENYRSKGKAKPDFRDAKAMIAFRQECRAYAEHWLGVQREEFKRLGGFGDWDHPYSTMSFPAEAQIAREIHKYAANGLLYRGSKPVMWSVVEKTALAEAEVEYEDHTSDTVIVGFPVVPDKSGAYAGVHRDDPNDIRSVSNLLTRSRVAIWTTTPWTLPGNRAIAYSPRIDYAIFEVTEAPDGNWAKVGDLFVLARNLASAVMAAIKVQNYIERAQLKPADLWGVTVAHPFRVKGYDFDIPLLSGDHVTDDVGTGFVHTAPSHGREDFELWMHVVSQSILRQRGIDPRIPYTVDENSVYTVEAPGFEGKRVLTEKGEKGDANEAVIRALIETGNLLARGKLKHQYPHSWRSKKPVIFRNTPQWFIAMDKPMNRSSEASAEMNYKIVAGEKFGNPATLRGLALRAIENTRWVPATGENRIRGMVNAKPDWVMSRQRAWGVPIAVFVRKGEHTPLVDHRVNQRIADAFEQEGADAWYAEGAAARFLQPDYDPGDYEKVDDVLDVWFDSGSTHAFVLDDPKHFPGLANIHRKVDGGQDEVMYLEGSDQHRGWFQASLLESCGTRGRAPYDIVLTHGFTLDEKGRKQSKSLGNQTFPQDIIKVSGADILRLWVASTDYTDDQRIGPDILKMVSDNYRKLRNSLRWMLGMLAHYNPKKTLAFSMIAPLDRLMLHRLAEIDVEVRAAYAAFDFARVVSVLSAFLNTDLSAFYFDVRKDALYCDPPSSLTRLGSLETVERIFRAVTVWLAPILVFTAEEAWGARYPDGGSVHLETFPEISEDFLDSKLAEQWDALRKLRSVVTGAIEIARAAKEIGASLEAAPVLYLDDDKWRAALEGVDFAEVCIVSQLAVEAAPAPEGAFRLADVPGAAVVVKRATGVKCARSWRYFDPATADPEYPDVTPRDAKALRELKG
jgi:isoleucyl-tRNA synthetase